MSKRKKVLTSPTGQSSRSLAVHPSINCSPTAKNEEQKNVLRSFSQNQITIVYGPAGTGKTMLATMFALNEFMHGKYEKLLFTRPCIEAFESLGYLPGSKEEKLAPYMIPIMTYLEEKLEESYLQRLTNSKQIVTLPLAFMRGVTFKNSFVIADEAQNTRPEQMRLFLTRIGEGSKVIVTGDLRQSDIGANNGLADAIRRFQGIEGIGLVELTEASIFRSKIVADIEARYTDKK